MDITTAIAILTWMQIAYREGHFGDVQKYQRWLTSNHYNTYSSIVGGYPSTLVLPTNDYTRAFMRGDRLA